MKFLAVVFALLLAKSTLAGPAGTCFWEPENRQLAVGETFTSKGGCTFARCEPDGRVSQVSCGLIGSNCQNPRVVFPDNNLPYPDCCPKAICD